MKVKTNVRAGLMLSSRSVTCGGTTFIPKRITGCGGIKTVPKLVLV
jgi:hypothetical protein